MKPWSAKDFTAAALTQGGTREIVAAALAQNPVPLDTDDMQAATVAWRWFHMNIDPDTGMAPDIAGGDLISVAGLAATITATLAATRLHLIRPPQRHRLLSHLLARVAELPLNAADLPAEQYRIRDLTAGRSADGQGHSADSILRLAAALAILADHVPEFTDPAARLLNGWKLEYLWQRGQFVSAIAARGRRLKLVPDLLLGPEQYAARTGVMLGMKTDAALDPKPHLGAHIADGVILPLDRRDRALRTIRPLPLIRNALHFGWHPDLAGIAAAILTAQRQLFEATGKLATPGVEPVAPDGTSIGTTFAVNDRRFCTMDMDGKPARCPAILSARCAYAEWVTLPSPFTRKLVDGLAGAVRQNGWQSGVSATSGQAMAVQPLQTNAMILEALHYRAHGPLITAAV